MTLANKAVYIAPNNQRHKRARFVGLLWALVARELKSRYRRSLLGPAWAVMQPLMYMVVFNFVKGVVGISSEEVPYPLFAYSALVPWTLLTNAVTRCGPSIYQNSAIIKKASVPKEVFPLAAVVVSICDFLISATILIAMMIWFRVPVTASLVWVPVLLLMSALLALGLGMVVAALGTYRRDIIFAVPFLMQFWLLISPVMYPLSQVPEKWQRYYSVNPAVGIIEGFRTVIVKGIPPDLGLLVLALLGTSLIWAVAWPLFRYTSRYFADII